jgi:hypothetical protein
MTVIAMACLVALLMRQDDPAAFQLARRAVSLATADAALAANQVETAENEEMLRAIRISETMIRKLREELKVPQKDWTKDQSLRFGEDLIRFDSGRTAVIWLPDGKPRMRTFCDALTLLLNEPFERGASILRRELFTVWVEGHTDALRCSGSDDCNWDLSAQRASAVRNEMAREEVCPGSENWKLRPIAMAASAPITAETSAEGRAKNRRIEIRVVPDYAAIIAYRNSKPKRDLISATGRSKPLSTKSSPQTRPAAEDSPPRRPSETLPVPPSPTVSAASTYPFDSAMRPLEDGVTPQQGVPPTRRRKPGERFAEPQPTPLTPAQVAREMGRYKSKVAPCLLGSRDSDRFPIVLTITPDGRVLSAVPEESSATALCVARAARKMEFHPFLGAPVVITHSFRH